MDCSWLVVTINQAPSSPTPVSSPTAHRAVSDSIVHGRHSRYGHIGAARVSRANQSILPGAASETPDCPKGSILPT